MQFAEENRTSQTEQKKGIGEKQNQPTNQPTKQTNKQKTMKFLCTAVI